MTHRHFSQVTLVDGRVLNTHNPGQCANEWCCIHNPSDHPLRGAPLNWRDDGLVPFMERICSHGIGHPDPDGLAATGYEWLSVHGCDGCCRGGTNQAVTVGP